MLIIILSGHQLVPEKGSLPWGISTAISTKQYFCLNWAMIQLVTSGAFLHGHEETVAGCDVSERRAFSDELGSPTCFYSLLNILYAKKCMWYYFSIHIFIYVSHLFVFIYKKSPTDQSVWLKISLVWSYMLKIDV